MTPTEQRQANSRAFILGDLLGWGLRIETRPSDMKRLEQVLCRGECWALVCGILRGINRTAENPPDYKASDLRRAV